MPQSKKMAKVGSIFNHTQNLPKKLQKTLPQKLTTVAKFAILKYTVKAIKVMAQAEL